MVGVKELQEIYNMDKYINKENYVTSSPHPDLWDNHENIYYLKKYSEYIVGNVLDFGCNHGAVTIHVIKDTNCNHVTGLDINSDAIKLANELKNNLYPELNIDYICANIMDVVIQNKFDSIVSFHTLEHIYPEHTEYVLRKLYKALNDNGYFLISIPYERNFYDEAHVSFYNENTLKEILEKCGFKTIECYYDDQRSNILTGLFKKEV